MKSRGIIPVFAAIIFVNSAGILLKLTGQPTFIILMGFRLHISLVIPFFFVMNRVGSGTIINEFKYPVYKKCYPFIISLILLPLIISVSLAVFHYMDFGDPEFFYEFGLSSVFDFPIYLLWNTPQLILLYFFLIYLQKDANMNKVFIFLILVLLFLFETIISESYEISVVTIASLVAVAFMNIIILHKFRNIYWFVLFNFTLFWLTIMLFGSESVTLVRQIFAANYNSWEGLMELNKSLSDYILLILFIPITISLIVLKSEKQGR